MVFLVGFPSTKIPKTAAPSSDRHRTAAVCWRPAIPSSVPSSSSPPRRHIFGATQPCRGLRGWFRLTGWKTPEVFFSETSSCLGVFVWGMGWSLLKNQDSMESVRGFLFHGSPRLTWLFGCFLFGWGAYCSYPTGTVPCYGARHGAAWLMLSWDLMLWDRPMRCSLTAKKKSWPGPRGNSCSQTSRFWGARFHVRFFRGRIAENGR